MQNHHQLGYEVNDWKNMLDVYSEDVVSQVRHADKVNENVSMSL